MTPKGYIAWIEDDIDVLDALMNPLRKAGFQILEYRTFTEAIKGIERIQQVDLICLDLILPPGNGATAQDRDAYLGLTLLRRLRHEYSLIMPVIVLSVIADGPDVDQAELEELGAVPLAKPVHLHDLKREVEELLGLQPA